MNFVDLLKKSFMNSWTGGSSIDPSTGKIGKPNRYHGKGTFEDFEFKDIFDNDRWVREDIGDPNPKSDRQMQTSYYIPRQTGESLRSSMDDAAPIQEAAPKPVLDLDISPGRIPIDSRSIPGNRWNKARIPDPRTQVPRIRPTRPPLRLGQQSNIRNRPPPRSVQRPPVTGPYNPQSLDSFAEYDQQRQREMERRQAIQNQRRTIRVPQDRNTAEAMRRAMGGYGQRTAQPTRPLLPPSGGAIAGRPAVPTLQTPQGIPRTTGAPRGIAAALEQYRPSLQSQGAIANDSAKRLAMDAASIAKWAFPRTGVGAMLYSPDVGDPNETADDSYWRTGGSAFPQTPGPHDPTEKVVTTQDNKGTKVVRTQQYPINDTRNSGQIMNIERLREMLGEAYFKRLFQ
jgi:hypothetical protein|tara:strand:+ start:3413 stop:4609 length:1197 start_codon:yes stop_codon:yes gene_type:complete